MIKGCKGKVKKVTRKFKVVTKVGVATWLLGILVVKGKAVTRHGNNLTDIAILERSCINVGLKIITNTAYGNGIHLGWVDVVGNKASASPAIAKQQAGNGSSIIGAMLVAVGCGYLGFGSRPANLNPGRKRANILGYAQPHGAAKFQCVIKIYLLLGCFNQAPKLKIKHLGTPE